MKRSQPLSVSLPEDGVLFAESVHASDFRMAEREDGYHKLIYVLSGSVELDVAPKNGGVAAGAGAVLVIPAGVRHRIRDVKPATLLLLCFDERLLGIDRELAGLWKTVSGAPKRRFQLTGPARGRAESIWRRAMLERLALRPGANLLVRVLAVQVLVLLARLPATPGGDDARVRVGAVMREVEETFFDDWTIDRAAARASLSRRRFSSVFREVTGKTFWDFLTARRLAHARNLLEAGEHTIMGVMFSCGFNDLSHFYRLFRREFGAPPRQWVARGSRRQKNGRRV